MTRCRTLPSLPPRVQAYLAAVLSKCGEHGSAIVSVVLFGSVATGGLSEISDVDLIFVLAEGSTQVDRGRLSRHITSLETLYGFRKPSARPGALQTLVERTTASDCSFFVCTREDLLSGRVSRILNLKPAQSLFVDRIVLASILSSAVTIWGEELLPRISVLPIRRFDIFKAFFALFCQVLVSAAFYPLLPRATRFAMEALKRSVHSCSFCYRGKSAALYDEIDFLRQRIGPSRALEQLPVLRNAEAPSFPFIARCLFTLVRLHLRTALDNRFPGRIRNDRR